jgi:DnaD/phage-associated family protein
MDNKILNWFLSGGSATVPKRLLAFMEPLDLDFDDLGRILYVSAQEGHVDNQDALGLEAVSSLVKKRLVTFNAATGAVDFSPLYDLIGGNLQTGRAVQPEKTTKEEAAYEAVASLMKRFEAERTLFLTQKTQQELLEAMLRYGFSEDLTHDLYAWYLDHARRSYSFPFLAQQAYSAGVSDPESLAAFVKNMDYELQKVREVLRLLGKYNNPTEPQRKLYRKWSRDWGFGHDVILMAIDETVGANNPSMRYLDAVLSKWHEQGAHTADQVRALKQKSRQARKPETGSYVKRGRSGVRYVSSKGCRKLSDLEE